MWVFLGVIALILVVTYVALYFYSTRKFDYWKKKGIPYKEPCAFFGNIKDFFKLKRSVFDILQEIYFENRKPYEGLFLMDEPTLLVRDTELIKNIFVKDFEHFTDRNIICNTKSDPVGGNMLFILKNPLWKDVRKKLTPVFTSGKVKALFEITADSGKQMVQYLKENCQNEEIFDAKEITALYSTENIVSTAFGIQANCFKNKDAEFRYVSKRMFDFNNFFIAFSQTCWFIAPKLVKLFNLRFIDTFCANFMTEAFWGAMKERERTKIPRNDLIDILLQMKNRNELEDQHILGQGAQFFTAGFETTSSTIAFALYVLAHHKKEQEKLRQEIRETIEKFGDLTYEAIQTMDYLDLVLKETMRMHPVVPFLVRKCNKDYQIPGTKDVIEEGTGIIILPFGLHRDPQYFPEPEKFIPERFTEENFSKLPQMCFLPFGEGPRSCIGMRFGLNSTKSGISNILNNFELDVCDETHKTITPHIVGHNYATIDNKVMLKFRRLK